MNEKTKDLAYYVALPYTIVIRKDEDGAIVARIQELPGCLAHGDTEASAIENLRSMQRLWLEDALSAGDAIPEPEDDGQLPSGKWLQRVPRKLHRELVQMAIRENVSLNQLVTSMLSEAITARSCVYAFEAFLSHSAQLIQPKHIAALWWGGKEPEATDWSIPSRMRIGSLTQGLSHVKRLAGKDLLLLESQYADEHTGSHKELTRK